MCKKHTHSHNFKHETKETKSVKATTSTTNEINDDIIFQLCTGGSVTDLVQGRSDIFNLILHTHTLTESEILSYNTQCSQIFTTRNFRFFLFCCLVKGLRSRGGRLKEDHIAYILYETLKGLIHLHNNHCMHR